MVKRSNIERLRVEYHDLWKSATTHPFVEELGSGSLSVKRFQRYLLQDYMFLDGLRRVSALAVAKAPDHSAARALDEFLGVLLGAEDSLFRRGFQQMDIGESVYRTAEALPITAAFCDFMVRVAYERPFATICSVLYVTEGVYLDWATRLRRAGAHPCVPIYAEWIEIHDEPALGPFVNFLSSVVDGEALDDLSELKSPFERALRYELAMWDMAYDAEKWP